MISKLDKLQGRDIYGNTALAKLNEVIDAVNELQEQMALAGEDLEEALKAKENCECAKNAPNLFYDKEKWIGCICRFWYTDPKDTVIDYLEKIQIGDNGVLEYYGKEMYDWYPHCEPVKPEDEAIFKGGKDE